MPSGSRPPRPACRVASAAPTCRGGLCRPACRGGLCCPARRVAFAARPAGVAFAALPAGVASAFPGVPRCGFRHSGLPGVASARLARVASARSCLPAAGSALAVPVAGVGSASASRSGRCASLRPALVSPRRPHRCGNRPLCPRPRCNRPRFRAHGSVLTDLCSRVRAHGSVLTPGTSLRPGLPPTGARGCASAFPGTCPTKARDTRPSTNSILSRCRQPTARVCLTNRRAVCGRLRY
jgi:hypothetical protein